jgi:hypothetical protein
MREIVHKLEPNFLVNAPQRAFHDVPDGTPRDSVSYCGSIAGADETKRSGDKSDVLGLIYDHPESANRWRVGNTRRRALRHDGESENCYDRYECDQERTGVMGAARSSGDMGTVEPSAPGGISPAELPAGATC